MTHESIRALAAATTMTAVARTSPSSLHSQTGGPGTVTFDVPGQARTLAIFGEPRVGNPGRRHNVVTGTEPVFRPPTAPDSPTGGVSRTIRKARLRNG